MTVGVDFTNMLCSTLKLIKVPFIPKDIHFFWESIWYEIVFTSRVWHLLVKLNDALFEKCHPKPLFIPLRLTFSEINPWFSDKNF